MKRHIFWDWNGTLFDDAWLCRDVMNRMLLARGLPELSEHRYQSIFSFPIQRYYEQVGFDLSRESFEALGAEFIRNYEARRMEASLFPDVLEALRRVQNLGWTQSILSAYNHDTLITLVEAQGIRDSFTDLHGHADIYPAGKEPQGRQAMQDLALRPGEAIMIGDTVHDAEVAEHLGIRCILLPGGNQLPERLQQRGWPFCANRLEALSLIEAG